jgi:hypothetical protein
MKKLILVPLKRNDRAEDLMPYVEEVVRPGMKAVFMVPYPVDGFRWSHEEIGRKAIERRKCWLTITPGTPTCEKPES